MAYKDPDRRREYGREWMKRNPEKAREGMRRWRKAHPEERNADRRAFYDRHREEMLAQSAEYHRQHPEVGRARSQNYRARKQAAQGSFTPAQWLALVEAYGGRCAYRGEQAPLEVDHRVPLSRGGSNLIENILPACRRCNAEKHQMTEEEFRARLAAEEGDSNSPPATLDG
jgi:5-methylcytosine-specific restriction endonuclease McrA